MNQPVWSGPSRTRSPSREAGHAEPANLADILERVLDKGIVIAGDIKINLLDIELLTIKIRLVVASVDRAREMGIDWWEHDPMLSSGDRDVLEENRRLRRRIGDLEAERGDGAAGRLEGGRSQVSANRDSDRDRDRDRDTDRRGSPSRGGDRRS
ncbi:gas vesicle protein [Streptomyces sp. NPDC051976]|uniref:gas vesicle protein n=1 Tax=Streptomyces sp. NPDC051976 TaxID=3154947 RepID=UPI003415EC72